MLLGLATLFISFNQVYGQEESHIRKRYEITNGLSPKSIITNGTGVFSAQNMMYRHTIMLFNETGEKIARISDAVNLRAHGFKEYSDQLYRGAPVEGVFTYDGKYLWVSNYQMTGPEFKKPGCDHCIGNDFDPSFLYKINIQTFAIESVIKVGSVPKFLAISKDGKRLITSNWVSSDISIIDLEKETEIKRVKVGPHPRGIAISKDARTAFVTIMGSHKVAVVNLLDYSVTYIEKLGKAPRSVLLGDQDSTLYISVNSSNSVVKINRFTNQKTVCKTPSGPRSIALSPDEKWLFVVNYFDDSFSKIATNSMRVEATITTGKQPIGICGDWENGEIWVACYSGKIEIFRDFKLKPKVASYFGLNLSAFISNPLQIESETSIDTTIVATKKLIKANPLEKTEQKKEIAKNNTSKVCQYHIIIDAFSIYDNALKRKAEIDALNYPGKIIQGKLNYVSIGCYQSRAEAEKNQKIIRSTLEGCETAWILNSK